MGGQYPPASQPLPTSVGITDVVDNLPFLHGSLLTGERMTKNGQVIVKQDKLL